MRRTTVFATILAVWMSGHLAAADDSQQDETPTASQVAEKILRNKDLSDLTPLLA